MNMWGTTDFKAREQRMRKRALWEKSHPKASLHLKRAKAEILVQQAQSTSSPVRILSRVILNDMTPLGLFVYTSVPLTPGQQIQLTMDSPARFFVHGKVISTQNVGVGSRVISEVSYPYRIQILFEFKSSGDQDLVQRYCQEVLGSYLRSA